MGLGPVLLLTALAAGPSPQDRTAQAVRVETGPGIDGDLSDPAWGAAAPMDGFTQQFPDQGRAPSGATEVRILYDDHALYFAFQCTDQSPGDGVARLAPRDADASSDAVIIDLDTRGDHSRAYHFEVSAAGVQRDAIRTGDRAVSFDWDAVWQSAVRTTSAGWTAEIAIPFAALRYDAAAHSVWRLQMRRYIAHRNETDGWVFIPPEAQNEMLHYGSLKGLDHLPAVHGIGLSPFLAMRLSSLWAPAVLGDPTGVSTSETIGLDARVGLTSGLTLQTTVLPDFGQVEADPAVLNLTTFEVHLDERRPFFLEGADLFETLDTRGNVISNQLFYSRRLGMAPPAPYLPTGATVVAEPNTTDIWTASKLTGRIGDHLQVAILDGVTAAEQAQIRLPSGAVVNEGVVPLTNFLVARLRSPIASGVTAGLTLTSVDRNEPHGAIGFEGTCPDGNPTGVDGRCTHDEQALAADVAWQPRGGEYAATAMIVGSRIAGGETVYQPDGTGLGSGALGVGGRAQLAKTSGHLVGYLVFETATPRLDLNDAGYLPQQNYRWMAGRVTWRSYDVGPLVANSVTLRGGETDSWRGLVLARGGTLSDYATFRSQWTVGASAGAWASTFDNREAGDGTPDQRPAGWWSGINVSSNPSRPLTFNAWTGAHSNWRGDGYWGGVTLEAKFLRRVDLSLSPSVSWNSGDPRHVDTLTAVGSPNTYLFGLQDAFTQSTTLRSSITFTPTISLTGYAQLFFSAVRYNQLYSVEADPDLLLKSLTPTGGDSHAYDSRGAVLNVSAVFRWEYIPGSALYVVYTHSQNGGALPMPVSPDGAVLPARDYDWNALERGQTADVFLAKVSYAWQG